MWSDPYYALGVYEISNSHLNSSVTEYLTLKILDQVIGLLNLWRVPTTLDIWAPFKLVMQGMHENMFANTVLPFGLA
jgi:hypothetical protein